MPVAPPNAGRGSRDEGIFQRTTQSAAHFGGGGLGEGDHENFLERSRRLFLAQAMQTTLDERVRFARARAGHDQHVAARSDRLPLGRRERIVLGAHGIHLAETLATDEHGVKPHGPECLRGYTRMKHRFVARNRCSRRHESALTFIGLKVRGLTSAATKFVGMGRAQGSAVGAAYL